MGVVTPLAQHRAYRDQIVLSAASVVGAAVLAAIADDGGLATLPGWERLDQPDARRVQVHPVRVCDHAQRIDLLTRIRDPAESGELRTQVVEIIPAREAARAHQRFERGGLRRRLVLAGLHLLKQRS